MRRLNAPDADADPTDPTAQMREALMAQASTLDAMFAELAGHAATRLKDSPGWAQPYVRLALRAQSNYRASLETMARTDRTLRQKPGRAEK